MQIEKGASLRGAGSFWERPWDCWKVTPEEEECTSWRTPKLRLLAVGALDCFAMASNFRRAAIVMPFRSTGERIGSSGSPRFC